MLVVAGAPQPQPRPGRCSRPPRWPAASPAGGASATAACKEAAAKSGFAKSEIYRLLTAETEKEG